MDNSDFKVEKSIAAAPSQTPSGIEVSFDIIYEPSRIGEFKSILTLTSPAGGEYIFPLHAICFAPKPQGPFQIKANSTTSIAFKNVFNQPLVFSFAIDNPLFHVNKSTELIKAHQTYKIVVGLVGSDNNASAKADVMAKLVVTAPRSAGNNNNVQWIYYLRGTN